MYLAGRTDMQEHRLVESILLEIGELFQIQDDYLDCYGDVSVMGKIGTDIRDAKCSWLVIQAVLRIESVQQRQLLRIHYGKQNGESETLIKQLYKQLNLESVYQTYHQKKLRDIIQRIESVRNQVPVEIFQEPLSHVFPRDKWDFESYLHSFKHWFFDSIHLQYKLIYFLNFI